MQCVSLIAVPIQQNIYLALNDHIRDPSKSTLRDFSSGSESMNIFLEYERSHPVDIVNRISMH